MEPRSTDIRKFFHEITGIFLLFCALLLLLGVLSFDAADPSINYIKSGTAEVKNKAGLFGAYAAGLLDDFFGVGALLWPAIFAVLGLAHLSARVRLCWWRWCGIFLLTLCFLTFAASIDLRIGDLEGGGMVGRTLLANSMRFLSPPGSALLWLFVFLAGLQMVASFSWIALCEKAWRGLQTRWQNRKNSPAEAKAAFKWQEHVSRLAEAGRSLCRTFGDWLAENLRRPKREQATADSTPLSLEMPGLDDPLPETTMQVENDPPLPKDALPDFALAEENTSSSQVTEIPPAVPAQEVEQEKSHSDSTSEPYIEPAPAAPMARAPASPPSFSPEGKAFILPEIDLLDAPQVSLPVPQAELEARGAALMNCFNDFDIHGELAGITPGPVVTMFEFRPAPGIRVSKIANLGDDLSLALKAVAVRIQAPIPGTDTIGIEIPNERREIVNFRELVDTDVFAKGVGPLTMILGKDIAGAPYMADLTRMPHMLVAGATGAGKSVCLNSILISLLYRMPPDRLKLLLIDPKRIEMAVYADLPHLVHPVVTEMEDATNALAWAVEEMENRFKTFMRIGVRNIAAYHEKLDSFCGNPPENLADLAPLPYMVIVIDELADLMLTAAREVEGKIQRLAQLARAAGIHMILATQRPSVDVVTGLIKAQFPCRISFQVSSKHDSRTILDQIGAEHLLGRGDMLFKPPGSKLMRLHGPFLKDEEVQAVVTHWRNQQAPDYRVDFSKWGAENGQAAPVIGGDATSDELYGQARAFVLEQGRASISLLQRHLKIGFNRAARLMEQFERDGIIGPADGSKPRVVIR